MIGVGRPRGAIRGRYNYDDERKDTPLMCNQPIAVQIEYHERMHAANLRAAESPDWQLCRADPEADRQRYLAGAEAHRVRLVELRGDEQRRQCDGIE
jgi:hypothetical protein